MTIPSRQSVPLNVISNSRTFFITSSIFEKRSLLQADRCAALFVDVLFHYRDDGKYLLHEFVVMPNHFHLLITLDCRMTVERAVQFIKGGFAFRAGRELGFRPPVWQKGFSEVRILSPEAYSRSREYIHDNPVTRHLVTCPEAFRFSSASGKWQLDPVPQGLKPSPYAVPADTAKAVS